MYLQRLIACLSLVTFPLYGGNGSSKPKAETLTETTTETATETRTVTETATTIETETITASEIEIVTETFTEVVTLEIAPIPTAVTSQVSLSPEPAAESAAPAATEVHEVSEAEFVEIATRFGYTPGKALAQIRPNLYLSSVEPGRNQEFLQALGITHVLNLTGFDVEKAEGGVTTQFGTRLRYPKPEGFSDVFTYKHIKIADEKMDAAAFEKFLGTGHPFINAALENPNHRVLVHCEAGISRSSTMVISYLMASEKKTLQEAYEIVKGKKSNIGPSIDFVTHLNAHESDLVNVGWLSFPTRYTPSLPVAVFQVKSMMELTGNQFTERDCELALSNAHGDVNAAINTLYSTM